MIRAFIAGLTTAVATALAPAPSEAGLISQIRTYSLSSGNVAQNIHLQFDPFNAEAATLLGVEYRFRFTVQHASVDFENTASVPLVNDISVDHINNYLAPGLQLLPGPVARSQSITLFSGFVSFAPFDGVQDFAGADSFAFRQTTPISDELLVDLTDFTGYAGDAPVPLEITSIFGSSAGSNPLTVSARLNGDDVSGSVELIYDFAQASIAEPATLALVMGALLAMSLFGGTSYRRRPVRGWARTGRVVPAARNLPSARPATSRARRGSMRDGRWTERRSTRTGSEGQPGRRWRLLTDAGLRKIADACGKRLLQPGPLRVGERNVVARSIERLQLALEYVVGVGSAGDHARQSGVRELHIANRSGPPLVHLAIDEARIEQTERLVARHLGFV